MLTGSGNWGRTSLVRGFLETCLPYRVGGGSEEDVLDIVGSYVLKIVTTGKNIGICKIN